MTRCYVEEVNRLVCALAILLLSLPVTVSCLAAQELNARLNSVVRGLDLPTYLTHAGDGSDILYIVEQRGRIRLLRNGVLESTPFLDIVARVGCCGERGLLSVAFPPGYTSKGYSYVNYTNRQGNTVISRFRTNTGRLTADPTSEQILLTITQPFANHNGGQMKFGPDGFLYIGMGDGGSGGDPQNNGQNRQALLGKMLRIDVESNLERYTVPTSNPFVNDSAYRPEIWALGLRNPWRFSFDRATGDMFIADVGQNALEEISYQPASSRGGENYGWRLMEGSNCFTPQNCNQQGLTLPIFDYGRSQGDCSVTGGYVYRGSRFPAQQGTYLFGDFCTGRLWGIRPNGTNPRWTVQGVQVTGMNISSFGEDEAGEVYLMHHEGSPQGEVFLLTFGAPRFTAGSIVNAASFEGGLVPGSIATLFGASLSTVNGIRSADAYPLPTSLNGARITINGIEAPIFAVANVGGREQINFQVPFNVLPGRGVLTLSNSGQEQQIEVNISAVQPGIFTSDGTQAAATSPRGVITEGSAASRGEAITLYVTGLGPVDQVVGSGQPSPSQPLARTVSAPLVSIGGVNAEVLFSGLAPGFAGLYQINVSVPASAGNGSQEVVVRLGGIASRPARIWIR
jgi:uncharacterized protein (TIGR03437 family)